MRKVIRDKTGKVALMVSMEAIESFARLDSLQRLRWLDEMRSFLSKALSPETKRIVEKMRQLE